MLTAARQQVLPRAQQFLAINSVRACSASPELPLAGVKVLDLTRVLAGPLCTQMLGDGGADVIKVERPGTGDDTRGWGPPFLEGSDGTKQSTYFLGVNRNKRSVALDLKSGGGQAAAFALATQWADVVVENSIPGKLGSYGLGAEQVLAANPRVVYASISGYGHSGPRSQLPAYDSVISAEGGLMSITGEADGPPTKPGVALVDQIAGLYMHGAIVQALVGGVGCHLTTSLFEAQVACLANVASAAVNSGTDGKRWGTAHPSIAPHRVFTAGDGRPIFLAAFNDAQFARLVAFVGHPSTTLDLPGHGEVDCMTNAARVSVAPALCEWLQERLDAGTGADGQPMSRLSREALLQELGQASIPASPVNTVVEALASPQAEALGMVQSVSGHRTLGSYKAVRHPVRVNGRASTTRLASPTLGEHSAYVAEVLAALGCEASVGSENQPPPAPAPQR